MDGNFPRRRLLRHHKDPRQVAWAGWLGAAEFADRHGRVVTKRKDFSGPCLDRFNPLRMIGTLLSAEGITKGVVEGIIEGVHATFLRFLDFLSEESGP